MIKLTEQEYKTLEFLVAGKNMKQIALLLGVSYSRVVNILNKVLIKTSQSSRRDLLINGKDIIANSIKG